MKSHPGSRLVAAGPREGAGARRLPSAGVGRSVVDAAVRAMICIACNDAKPVCPRCGRCASCHRADCDGKPPGKLPK